MEGDLALLLGVGVAELRVHTGDPARAVVDDRGADVATLVQPRARLLRLPGQLLVEVVPLPYESVVGVGGEIRPVQLEADAAADDAEPLVPEPARLLRDVDSHGDELFGGARCQPVTAHLLPRERGLFEEQDVQSGLGQVVGGGGTGWPGPDDDHIGGVFGEGLGLGHDGFSPSLEGARSRSAKSRNPRAEGHGTWAVYAAVLITWLKGCPVNRALPVVHLRVPTDEDAFAWHRVFADPDVMEFHGGKPAELSFYEELTARQRRHDAEYGFCFWTMLDEEGQVIGFTGAQPWPREWGPKGEIEIGWRLGRKHWGKGTSPRPRGSPWRGCARRAYPAWWPW